MSSATPSSSVYQVSWKFPQHFATPCTRCKEPRDRLAIGYQFLKQHQKYVHGADPELSEKLVFVNKVTGAVPAVHSNDPKICAAHAVAKVHTTPSSSVRSTAGVSSTGASSVGASCSGSSSGAQSSSAVSWGAEGGLIVWAEANLRSETQLRLFSQYRECHSMPDDLVARIKNTSKTENRLFQCFTDLPGELRNKIFNYAIQDELKSHRQVKVSYDWGDYGDKRPHEVVACRTGSPALMRVNRESRSLASHHYLGKVFSGPVVEKKIGYIIKKPEITVMNFDRDELFLHTKGVSGQLHQLVSIMPDSDCAKIKHLATPLKEYISDRTGEKDYWGPLMAKFYNLETLRLVIGDGHEDERFIRSRKSSFLERANRAVKWHLDKRFADKSKKAPKVTYQLVDLIDARRLGIDDLVYAGEGGFGPLANGRR